MFAGSFSLMKVKQIAPMFVLFLCKRLRFPVVKTCSTLEAKFNKCITFLTSHIHVEKGR